MTWHFPLYEPAPIGSFLTASGPKEAAPTSQTGKPVHISNVLSKQVLIKCGDGVDKYTIDLLLYSCSPVMSNAFKTGLSDSNPPECKAVKTSELAGVR